ncbi:MAG: type II toxin-antitoxin system CcdA family antitoxin [Jannaschia sp.]
MIQGVDMGRVKVNLTLDAEIAQDARSLGLNMSRLAETAIAEAAKLERNRLWRIENAAAIGDYAEEVAREGLPLGSYRSF